MSYRHYLDILPLIKKKLVKQYTLLEVKLVSIKTKKTQHIIAYHMCNTFVKMHSIKLLKRNKELY